jgi:hypothetical protein
MTEAGRDASPGFLGVHMLTAARLRELLEYNPETGVFTWRAPAGRWGRIPAGTVAGSTGKTSGYVEIHFEGGLYKAHRLAWLYMTGEWPADELDHINRVRGDNRFENLRECTTAENMQNKNLYISNTSGCAGVTWHKRIQKWQARIGAYAKRRHLGYWDSQAQAAEAYAAAKRVLHVAN